MHLLLLLLEDLLLPLELVLTSLKLCEVGSSLLCLSCLVLLHLLKNGNQCGSIYGAGGAELELPASASCLLGGI